MTSFHFIVSRDLNGLDDIFMVCIVCPGQTENSNKNKTEWHFSFLVICVRFFFYYKLWLLVQNYEILSEDLKLVSLPSRSFVADSKPAVWDVTFILNRKALNTITRCRWRLLNERQLKLK